MNCLLIKTQDKRKFLVNKKLYEQILEYSKTFKSEIYEVEVLEGKAISQLKTLAEAICNPEFTQKLKVNVIKKC